MRKLTIISICLVLIFEFSLSSSVMASDEDDVLKVAQNFNKAMNENDLNLISSLWLQTQEASFFGPNSTEAFLTCSWEEVEKFFKSMYEMPPGAASFSSYNPQVTILSDKVAIVTEYCIVSGSMPDASEQFVMQMRASIILQKVSGKWQIAHGHWSLLPTD